MTRALGISGFRVVLEEILLENIKDVFISVIFLSLFLFIFTAHLLSQPS